MDKRTGVRLVRRRGASLDGKRSKDRKEEIKMIKRNIQLFPCF